MGSFILGGVVGSPVVNPNQTKAPTNVIKSAASTGNPTTALVGLTPRMKLMAGVGFCGSFSKSFGNFLPIANISEVFPNLSNFFLQQLFQLSRLILLPWLGKEKLQKLVLTCWSIMLVA
jgi:hypothetical protein